MINTALAERWDAWEARMAPTLEALRDGAQSALMTNVLLVGDGRFVEKGFIQETRDRFTSVEERITHGETRQDEMHAENKVLSRKVIKRQGVIIRCVKYFSGKEGAARRHAITAAAAAVGGSATFAVQHLPAWYNAVKAFLR